jgi:hypothetical protein
MDSYVDSDISCIHFSESNLAHSRDDSGRTNTDSYRRRSPGKIFYLQFSEITALAMRLFTLVS